jgi:hypothetical protein
MPKSSVSPVPAAVPVPRAPPAKSLIVSVVLAAMPPSELNTPLSPLAKRNRSLPAPPPG